MQSKFWRNSRPNAREALATACLAGLVATTASDALAGGDDGWPDFGWDTRGWIYDDYRIARTKVPDTGQAIFFIITNYDDVVFTAVDQDWYVSDWPNENVEIGADITGDSIPNLIVNGYSGGAHCCLTTWLFDIGNEFRVVGAYGGGDYPVRFRQLDDKPGLELIKFENAFAYWYVGFARAPAPRVVYRWQDGEYVPAPDLMRHDPPSESTLAAIAEEYADDRQWSRPWTDDEFPLPTGLLGEMLDLTYSGNLESAYRLLDFAWPAGLEGRGALSYEYFCQLQRANFWEIVAPLNGLEPTPPADDCPDDARWR